jgi:N-acetylmuramoyl-L-alanine amidase
MVLCTGSILIRINNRSLNQSVVTQLNGITKQKKLTKSSRKRFIRYSILFANILMLVGVLGFVITTGNNGSATNNSIINATDSTAAAGALDELSSADIAVHVAKLTNLPQTPSVTNKADTVNAQLAVTPADDTVVAKPQVVATELKSYKDIQNYTTVQGDTIPSIAAKFGVTSDTIRWSNGLQGDNVQAGKVLVIAPVNGIVYEVKAGDTIDSIAAKYKANRDQIIADNDAETTGLKVGSKILIRDGSVTPVAARGFSGAARGFAWGGGAVYGGNGYDYGYCTWYVKNRRPDLPNNLGNASTWRVLAQRAGFAVGNVPQAGAVIWTPPRDYYGHVGYVESVNADGSVNISEMNVRGWGVRSTKTLSAEEAARYSYIY